MTRYVQPRLNDVTAADLEWRYVGHLVRGDRLATLSAGRPGDTLVNVARRINRANLQPAIVLSVEYHGSHEIRVTYKVRHTTMSTGWRPDAQLPVYLNMRDNNLTGSATPRDSETPNRLEL